MKYKIAIIAAGLILTACSARDADVGATETTVTKTLASHPHPKPGAQVSLIDHQLYMIEPGEDSLLSIRLRSQQVQGLMRVTITGSEGLNIRSSATEQVFTLAPGVIHELPLQVHVEQPGRYYVHLNIVTESSGRQSSRVMSVIVQAGKDQPLETLRKLDANAESGAEGESPDEPLITLPAREIVIQ